MKALILVLLTAAWAQSQTLADLARQERARKGSAKSSIVIKMEPISKPPEEPAEKPKPEEGATAAPPAEAPAGGESSSRTAPVDAAAASALAAVQLWNAETEKIRDKVQELADREVAIQLEINSLTSQVNAPVISQSARNEAMIALQPAQQRLATARAELATARKDLEQREKLGPPKK